MALPATDSFVDTNGTRLNAHDASWDEFNVMEIQSNAAVCNTPSDECAATWEGDVFDNDQYSEVIMSAVSAGEFLGASVRGDGDDTYYGWYADSAGESWLHKNVAGDWTQLGNNGGTFSVNDVVRLEAEGTTITPFLNDVEDDPPGAQTDNSIASGGGGLVGYYPWASSGIGSWEGGNIGVAADAMPMAMHYYHLRRV